MNAVRINLLPHREQKRAARQRQFVTLAITLAVLGLAVVALVHGVLAAQIENQNDRNRLLQSEIAKLDEQIRKSTGCASRSRRCLRASRSSKRCRRTATRPCT